MEDEQRRKAEQVKKNLQKETLDEKIRAEKLLSEQKTDIIAWERMQAKWGRTVTDAE